MKYIAYIITVLLFVGPVVLAQIGWRVEGDIKGSLRFYPAFYILLFYVVYIFFQKTIKDKYNYFALTIIVITITYYIIPRIAIGFKSSAMVLLNSMALPSMYYIFWSNTSHRYKKNIKQILLILFVFNSLMAIYERITSTLFFPFDLIRNNMTFTDIEDISTFRSTALLAHPLSNALIMSIIMMFILLSDMKPIKKYLLYSIGFIGVFCFNARAAIMIDVALLALYYFKQLFSYNISTKTKFITILLAIISVYLIQFIFESNLAGRFADRGSFLHDESVLQRFYAWMLFDKYDINNFLWGLTSDTVEQMTYSTYGTRYIESWFIGSVLGAGLIVTVLVVLLFIPLFARALRPYNRYNSFLLIVSCIGLASTNNSLACGVPAIATFFTCCYAFSTKRTPQKILTDYFIKHQK